VIIRATFALFFAAGLAVIPAAASSVHRAPTSGHAHAKRHITPATTKTHKLHGQQAIDSDRVTEIQQALIREHYLSGAPTTKWDSDTQAAMTKFQADQGWQTKLMPDSRALIKLGLGPDHSNAINASNSANFNQLSAPADLSSPSTQGFASAAGVSVNH